MGKLNLKQFYKLLVDFVKNNPDLVTTVGVSAPIVIKLAKSGALSKVISETIAGLKTGLTGKEAFKAALSSQAVKSAIINVGKGVAVAAAAAFALGTLKEAVKGGQVAVKADEPGWKKILSFAWNTSIPGATVNQFRAFGKWLTTKPSDRKNDETGNDKDNTGNKELAPVREHDELKDANNINPKDDPNYVNKRREEILEYYTGGNNQPLPSTQDRMNEYLRRREGNNMSKNDPKWYKEGKFNAISYSGEFNFDTKNGDYAISPLPKFESGTIHQVFGLPSVASLEIILTLGNASKDLNPNMFYDVTTKIKALNKNSALTSTWDRTDLIKLIHTMRVIYAGWLTGIRAYKLVNEFGATDLTLPYAYFAAMGLDYDSWQAHRAQIQEDLKFVQSMMSVYVDFGKLALFKRTDQLFMNGYADGKSKKAQKIIFRLSSATRYYDFNTDSWVPAVFATDNNQMSGTSTGLDYSTWLINMRAIIGTLLNVPKVQDMLSCLRFVYGTSGDKVFLPVPATNDKFNFVYEPEVMAQIENCTPIGDRAAYAIVNDTNNNWYFESITLTKDIRYRKFNSHLDKMTKDEQIVATRLQVARLADAAYSSDNYYFGTEVPVMLRIITVNKQSAFYKKLDMMAYYENMSIQLYAPTTSITDQANAAWDISKLGLLLSFDWAPILNMYFVIQSGIETPGIINADWESYAQAYGGTVEDSVTWMSYIRNGNYSLFSQMQTDIDRILDKARTA